MARARTAPSDQALFDLLHDAGRNALSAARMLEEMLGSWPDGREALGREILKAEQDGDRITHEIIKGIDVRRRTPVDRQDIYGLATQVDDVVDYIEEAADFLGLYQIEAPMQQSVEMSRILVASCEQVAAALGGLRELTGLEAHLVEIHRLENEGDRASREAVASLFADGIDPMVVIRWKDIFDVLEAAVDATESVAHIIERITLKRQRVRPWWRFGS